MKNSIQPINLWRPLGAALATIALFAIPAQAATDIFTNGDANNSYNDAFNWSSFSVPSLSTGDTAVIGDGSAVTYDGAGSGDLIISNGGTLEISNGSFTQTTGNNYLQLGAQGSGTATGNGNILINGGTFNQGTVSSTPFNTTGTGNTFTITSGAANITSPFEVNSGLTYNQSGGVVTTGGEFDFNAQNTYMSGGVLNTTLMTGVNDGGSPTGMATFYLSGGIVNLSSGTGIYGGGTTQYVDFTTGSTGALSFNGGTTVATIDGMITAGVIEYNAGGDASLSDFSITTVGSDEVVTLAPSLEVVPEPSTYVLFGMGFAGLLFILRRRSADVVR